MGRGVAVGVPVRRPRAAGCRSSCSASLIAAALARGGRFAGSRPGLALLVLLAWAHPGVVQAQPGGSAGAPVARLPHSFSYVFDAEWRRHPGAPRRLPAASALLDLHSRTHPPVPLLVRGLMLSPAAALAGTGRGRHRGRPGTPWPRVSAPAIGDLLRRCRPAVALVSWASPAASPPSPPGRSIACRSWGCRRGRGLGRPPWLLTPARSLFTPVARPGPAAPPGGSGAARRGRRPARA